MAQTQGGTQTRQRLLRVAAELFAEKGYHATGMTELGEAAELGRGAIYYHIGSKEQLLYDVCSRHVLEMVAFGEQLLLEGGPVVDRLRRLSRILLRTIADNQSEVTVFFREVRSLTGERNQRLIGARDRFEAIWQQLLDEGVSGGELRSGGPLLVKGLLGLHNYTYLWLRADEQTSPEDVADLFLDAVLYGISSTQGAPLPKPELVH